MPTSYQIEREIFFYRIDIGKKNKTGDPAIFNPLPTLEHIDKLDWNHKDWEKGRYWKDDNDRWLGCWIDSKSKPYKIRLGSIKRSDFPQIEDRGNVLPLEIAEKSGLVESIHMVFFDNNIVGSDFNFQGPRISKFPYYLADKAVGIAPQFVNFNPILRRDVYKQLKQLGFLTMFHLKINPSQIEVVKEIDQSLHSAFAHMQQASEASSFEVILTAPRGSSGTLSERILETTMGLANLDRIMHGARKFVVKGYDTQKMKAAEVDLLNGKLVAKKMIAKAERRSRALSKVSAYNSIVAAYEELKEEILESASIEL